jgi:RNA polymerase sigma-70 factor (ECF subfamily)
MKEALAQELTKYASRMYRVALRMVGSADAAQDVAQDACVKALRNANQFDGRATLSTWLHRITVNCAHDHLRKSRQLDRQQGGCDHDATELLAMLDAGPAQRAEQTEMYRLAMALIANLPEDCRSAFQLTQLDGYTYDEAAAIENLSRGTVASRVHRARKILMEQIAHQRAGGMS